MNGIIEAIDKEIATLKEARALLSNIPDVEKVIKRRGRPPGSVKKAATESAKPKRILSPEAKAKIAAAQKKRWAAAKKAA